MRAKEEIKAELGASDARRVAACLKVCNGVDTDLLEGVAAVSDTVFIDTDMAARFLLMERNDLLKTMRQAYVMLIEGAGAAAAIEVMKEQMINFEGVSADTAETVSQFTENVIGQTPT